MLFRGMSSVSDDGQSEVCSPAGSGLATHTTYSLLMGKDLPEKLSLGARLSESLFMWCSSVDHAEEAGSPVSVNVYSVGNRKAVRHLNNLTKKAGGVFHAAVQIRGKEWSFGHCAQGCGVYSCPPRRCPLHTYRESVYLGDCGLSARQVRIILETMRRDWPGASYDVLHKNCCTFCDAFLKKLLGNDVGLPRWIDRFARAAARVDDDVRRSLTAVSAIDSMMASRITSALRGFARLKNKHKRRLTERIRRVSPPHLHPRFSTPRPQRARSSTNLRPSSSGTTGLKSLRVRKVLSHGEA
ncbi:hypothetical protein CTAYLR_000133 [Chrysophaeum taylorii]|uniref:PPPDE domain-containing protein n=1 Tax=Chrysophaeum taylorii TaxID=2483200 RepID=A0AAD7XK51_9STRA|nr:hypothetical protein CTAYLR_000133 [Chrysophaeum taylorii]